MEVHFTIGWPWVEFLCHFMAAFLYLSTGYDMATGRDVGVFTFIAAVALTIIGANL